MTANFVHDNTTVYYPQAPGRVYSITIAALAASADVQDLDWHWEENTAESDVADMVDAIAVAGPEAEVIVQHHEAPAEWPFDGFKNASDRDADFSDALESWADWCDEDGERSDAFDGKPGAVVRAA